MRALASAADHCHASKGRVSWLPVATLGKPGIVLSRLAGF
jgi:hypothetical protein